jgi:hypothetical protein
VRPFLFTGHNYLQRVSDFTASNSVFAESTSSHGLFKIYAMIMLSKHKMIVCSYYEFRKDDDCSKKAKVSSCCIILMV